MKPVRTPLRIAPPPHPPKKKTYIYIHREKASAGKPADPGNVRHAFNLTDGHFHLLPNSILQIQQEHNRQQQQQQYIQCLKQKKKQKNRLSMAIVVYTVCTCILYFFF